MVQHIKIIICISFVFLLTGLEDLFAATKPDLAPPGLIAVKGKHSKHYLQGNFLRITYKTESSSFEKISGRLIYVYGDSIEITSLKKRRGLYRIAVSDIQSVQKLHKNGRKGWVPVMAVLVLLTVLGLINITSLAAFIFLAAPVVSLFTVIPYLIGSFLSDLISKKSVPKGWTFKTQ